MEYHQLGRSGLRVSALSLGTMTFGGSGAFQHVGTTDRDGARRIVDLSLDAGVNLVDTADGTPTASRRSCSAPRSRAGATGCSLPRRRASPRARGQTTRGSRGIT